MCPKNLVGSGTKLYVIFSKIKDVSFACFEILKDSLFACNDEYRAVAMLYEMKTTNKILNLPKLKLPPRHCLCN